MLIPPLVLIFLVLGTIFLGVATPTEGGAMGAVGALLMAVANRRLSMSLLKQALVNTTRLSCFVMFILIGSTVFSFTFNAAEGHIFVESLFRDMPGGAMGFLIIVNVLIFILGCFIDFFEIAFIVIPLLAPVAEKILPALLPAGTPPEWTLIWFGVIVAMNLQTSFLTPPFGFALFYLRSVAPRTDYADRVTGATHPRRRQRRRSTRAAWPSSRSSSSWSSAVIAFPGLVVGDSAEGARGPRHDPAGGGARVATATSRRRRRRWSRPRTTARSPDGQAQGTAAPRRTRAGRSDGSGAARAAKRRQQEVAGRRTKEIGPHPRPDFVWRCDVSTASATA